MLGSVASERNDDSIPALATLVRGVGAAASVAQTLLRAAGGALSSAVAAVTERAPLALRRRSRPPAPTTLRAIAGGAARSRRRHDVRATPGPDGEPAPNGLLGDDTAPLLEEEHDVDRVVVLARDPRSIFAYWHLGSETRARRDHLRAGSTLLRDALRVTVADASGGERESWIVPLGLLADGAHVDLARPRATVRVAVGLHADGAAFDPLAESTVTELPPSAPATLGAPRWRTLESPGEGAADAPPAPRREVADELLARAAAWTRPSSHALPLVSRDAGSPRDAIGRVP